MRFSLIVSVAALSLAVSALAHADEPGQVIHRPQAQQQEDPNYPQPQEPEAPYPGEYPAPQQGQVVQQITIINQNAPQIGPDQYYVPGYGIPAGFPCTVCVIQHLGNGFSQVVSPAPQGGFYLVRPPIQTAALPYLIDAIRAQQPGMCAQIVNPAPVVAPPVVAPVYPAPVPAYPPVYGRPVYPRPIVGPRPMPLPLPPRHGYPVPRPGHWGPRPMPLR